MANRQLSPKKQILIFVSVVISSIAGSMLQTALTTALLTSLRTIAGAIGSAVFVAIMTNTAKVSAAQYGEAASIHGVNMSFLAMTASSLCLLLAFWAMRKKENA